MLNIHELWIDNACFGQKMLLTDVRPVKEYQDGKATGTITGYRYDVCLPAKKLEKLSVKIDGSQLLDAPVDGAVEVQLTGLVVSVYQAKDGIGLSAKATGISLVSHSKQT